MTKPTIGSLLNQSGYTTFTISAVTRAINTLYGRIGLCLDERDWTAILATQNPLEAAEAALISMYQSTDYLLRNANYVVGLGYSANQIDWTYRQIYKDLGINYAPVWAVNTSFQNATQLSFDNLKAAAGSDYQAGLPIPTLTVASSVNGFTITLSEAGMVTLSVAGSLGSYGAGATLLTERSVISGGTMSVTGSSTQKTSAATAAYFTFGTTGNDTINLTGEGARVDYVSSGAGNDEVRGGAGGDILLTGSGNDTVLGNEGTDLIYGGDGDDNIQAGQDNDTVYGGLGQDTIDGGTTGNDVLEGEAGEDSLLGGAGDDSLTGGSGWDILTGGTDTDYLYLNSGNLEQERVNLDIRTDGADVIDGFHFGGGLGGFGFDRMDLTAPAGLTRLGGAANSLTDNINGGAGVAGAYPADTALVLDRTLSVIAGNDQLGAGTTVANAAARAVTQLSDGAQDYLGNSGGANEGSLVLLTDDGTSHYLFLVVDANGNRVTETADVTLVAVFTNSVNIANITMIDFNI
jgi:hypothetical protein